MAFVNEKTVQIKVEGSKTGETWAGEFKFRIVLSQLDEINADRRRRELLGNHADQAHPNAGGRAAIFGELAVRIISSPSWWKDAAEGLLLLDDEPVTEVYNAAMAAEAEHAKVVKERAAKAKAALQATQPVDG